MSLEKLFQLQSAIKYHLRVAKGIIIMQIDTTQWQWSGLFSYFRAILIMTLKTSFAPLLCCWVYWYAGREPIFCSLDGPSNIQK